MAWSSCLGLKLYRVRPDGCGGMQTAISTMAGVVQGQMPQMPTEQAVKQVAQSGQMPPSCLDGNRTRSVDAFPTAPLQTQPRASSPLADGTTYFTQNHNPLGVLAVNEVGTGMSIISHSK